MRSPSKIRLALAITLVTSIARAAGPTLENPDALAGCPSTDDLRRAVAAQLGREVDSSVVVRVQKGTEEGALVAEIRAADGRRRSIEDRGGTCADLVRASALTIALAIEEDEAKVKAKKEPPPPPPPPPPAVLPPPAPRLVRDDRFVATAYGLTTIGLLPRAAAGLGLGLRARVAEGVWISARGAWLPATAIESDAFALALGHGGLGACFEPFATSSVAAVGCGHLVVGAYDVTRASVPLVSEKMEAHVAASLSAGARAKVFGPLHLEGALEAQLPFTRPTYVTNACPVVGFEPAFVALGVWIGAGVSIP